MKQHLQLFTGSFKPSLRALVPGFFALLLAVIWSAHPASAAEPNQPAKTKEAKSVGQNPEGTYNLVSVDGKKVPCTLEHEGHSMKIQSGTFTFTKEGTCSSKIFLAGRDAGIETKATWARQGSKIDMKWQGAGTTTGKMDGNTFTMLNEGMAFVYRK